MAHFSTWPMGFDEVNFHQSQADLHFPWNNPLWLIIRASLPRYVVERFSLPIFVGFCLLLAIERVCFFPLFLRVCFPVFWGWFLADLARFATCVVDLVSISLFWRWSC
ncbi:hypothetical protein PRUPE_6G202900 [Prunus persica]|uniref:Uncharacterized protein n=1 Tax=Prunus persica TaxID=3760 RepID=M5WKM7_PRUPE|nr:hypothetical protein PRUPE_6G202900 [Prunus persica]